jgi:hypothetical protein
LPSHLPPGVFFEESLAGLIGQGGPVILKGKAVASHRITRFRINGQVHRGAPGRIANGVLKAIEERKAQQALIAPKKEETLIGQGLMNALTLGLRKQ